MKASFCSKNSSKFATRSGTESFYENKWFSHEDPDALPPSPSEKRAIEKRKEKLLKEQQLKGMKDSLQRVPTYHPKTDLILPPLTLSCLRYTLQSEHHVDVVLKAIDQGINMFETS